MALAVGCIPLGCSPSAGSPLGQRGAGSTGGADSMGLGGMPSGYGGDNGGPVIIPITDAGARRPVFSGPDGSCAATTARAEQIVVETQVPVTVEVTSRTPVQIYFMQDQSGSMLLPGSLSFTPKWEETRTSLTTFVNDPNSAGLDVAIQYFALAGNSCNDPAYATPEVPMGTLPGNAAAIANSLTSHFPSTGTPIEPALRGVTAYCVAHTTPEKPCVAVLLTDGAPSDCAGDTPTLAGIAQQAYDQAQVVTFAIGMDGANFDLLNAIGAAGHGDCTPGSPGNEACNVTAGPQAFIDALNTIRQTVTRTETHLETRQETRQTKLACEFQIPAPPAGQKFDPKQVNVEFKSQAGTETVYHVPTVADCAGATTKAWYYDDEAAPTKILVCPDTCTAVRGPETDGGVVAPGSGPPPEVQVLLGCATKPIPAR